MHVVPGLGDLQGLHELGAVAPPAPLPRLAHPLSPRRCRSRAPRSTSRRTSRRARASSAAPSVRLRSGSKMSPGGAQPGISRAASAATSGSTWARPSAPAAERARGFQADSWRTRPASTQGGTPVRRAAASISARHGSGR